MSCRPLSELRVKDERYENSDGSAASSRADVLDDTIAEATNVVRKDDVRSGIGSSVLVELRSRPRKGS